MQLVLTLPDTFKDSSIEFQRQYFEDVRQFLNGDKEYLLIPSYKDEEGNKYWDVKID